MTERVKVSSRYQIAVPSSVRRQLDIKSGDHLLITVRDGIAVLVPEPESITEQLAGLHKEIWEGVDVQEYIDGERDAWEE